GVIHPLRFGTRDANGHWRLVSVEAPGRLLLLGADDLGRDIWSRLLHGARLSLFAGLLATLVAVATGLIVGLLTGIAGPTGAAAGGFVIDVTLAMPWVYLLLAVRAALPLDLEPPLAFFATALLIGLLGWARLARLICGTVAALREREFIVAARASGVSRARLLRAHVLPHTWPVAFTQATLLLPQFVLAEVTLSFLGLGAADAQPSWGTLLGSLQHATTLTHAWWQAIPAIALVPVFLLYYGVTRSVGGAPVSS
ncbi:MAG: ABC transporter permease, partial [Vicinamibacterales bacterium]